VINRLKAVFAAAVAWACGPARAYDDVTRHSADRPSQVDLDEVLILAEDLRNVLTVVIACANAMQRGAARGLLVDRDFRDLDAGCTRGHRILQRLMNIDQLSQRESYPIDVNVAILECSEMLERALGDGIRLNLQLAPGREYVLAERLDVERVLLNLAMCGRHSMPDHGVLTIETASLKEVPPGLRPPHVRARSYVRLTVADTGAGMPSGTRMRVLGSTPPRDQYGTDLGMAAVAHTVRSLDGALSIEGDDGRGTRVTIDLPCVETAVVNGAGGYTPAA
jgi:signal transduction histidine kinase